MFLLQKLTMNSSLTTVALEMEFMNVFSRLRVDSRSLRSTLSYELTLNEFTDNLPKPPEHCLVCVIHLYHIAT